MPITTSPAAWTSAMTACHHLGPSSKVYEVEEEGLPTGLPTGAGASGAAEATEEEEDEGPVR